MAPDIDYFWVQLFISWFALPILANFIHILFIWFNIKSLKETSELSEFKLPLCIMWLIASLVIFSSLAWLVASFAGSFTTAIISVLLMLMQLSLNVFHIIKENERRSKQKSGF